MFLLLRMEQVGATFSASLFCFRLPEHVSTVCCWDFWYWVESVHDGICADW